MACTTRRLRVCKRVAAVIIGMHQRSPVAAVTVMERRRAGGDRRLQAGLCGLPASVALTTLVAIVAVMRVTRVARGSDGTVAATERISP